MRTIFTLSLLAAMLLPLASFPQLNNGGLYANFGVDGDTHTDYLKYGLVTGNTASDDWFSSTATRGVLDTSNSAYYLSLLQSGANVPFYKRMSVPLYTKINGRLWLDAVYARDYMAAASLKDTTTFTTACKNGDNPSVWTGGVSSFPNKNDLVDVYAHMRRDGVTVHDSLWLFTGVSTYGTTGSAYFDIELYKNSFGYNGTTGTFTTAGPDAGHTQWLFDASGNIIQTGDLILAVNCTPGAPPVVDVRIWVSQATWSSVIPSRFSFNANFNGATPAFGYASIVSKAGTTAFGAGITNYSATATQDTTLAGPWGTNSTLGWGSQYQSLQFTEMGLNLSRIGVDPALYTALGSSACQSMFSSIFFKSRASNSFTANMKDFVTPLVFVQSPVMDYSLQPDTLRCNKTIGTILITNNTTAGYYTWQNPGGGIIGSNSDSSRLSINKPGTYIVSASPAQGCPATRTDTVKIPIDTFPPEASVNLTMPGIYFQLYGGDVAASNYPTPFGGSQGLLWNWSGPQGFASTIQNPRTTDTAWGTYQLIVTEKRNGCTDTATRVVSPADFIVLLASDLKLAGKYNGNAIVLNWEGPGQNAIASYEVEKLSGSSGFVRIGTISSQSSAGPGTIGPAISGSAYVSDFSFADRYPVSGSNTYRIKATGTDGQVYYSRVITVDADATAGTVAYISNNNLSSATLTVIPQMDCQATLVLYNLLGQIMQKREVHLSQGMNRIDLSPSGGRQPVIQVVTLFIGGKSAYSQKVIL